MAVYYCRRAADARQTISYRDEHELQHARLSRMPALD